jgi:hypothetical protein
LIASIVPSSWISPVLASSVINTVFLSVSFSDLSCFPMPTLRLATSVLGLPQELRFQVFLNFLVEGLRVRQLLEGLHHPGLLVLENAVKIRPSEYAMRTHEFDFIVKAGRRRRTLQPAQGITQMLHVPRGEKPDLNHILSLIEQTEISALIMGHLVVIEDILKTSVPQKRWKPALTPICSARRSLTSC